MGGKVSEQGDVYSYGILLLEMFSGKRPTDDSMFMGSASLHEYVKRALPHKVMEIADPQIMLEQEDSSARNQSSSTVNNTRMEICLASIFRVGLLCSAEIKSERMGIKNVLTELNVARDLLLGVGSKTEKVHS